MANSPDASAIASRNQLAGAAQALQAYEGGAAPALLRKQALTAALGASSQTLSQLASDSQGRATLLNVAKGLEGLTTSSAEKVQAHRIMQSVSDGANQERTPQIEVLTFLTGDADVLGKSYSALLDQLTALAGLGQSSNVVPPVGHSAIAINDVVYSFGKYGWVTEGLKADYLQRKSNHNAIGQTLGRLSPPEVTNVQRDLNRLVGTGTYLANSSLAVCADAVAQTLASAIGEIHADHDPQHLADLLGASGTVTHTQMYANILPQRPSRR